MKKSIIPPSKLLTEISRDYFVLLFFSTFEKRAELQIFVSEIQTERAAMRSKNFGASASVYANTHTHTRTYTFGIQCSRNFRGNVWRTPVDVVSADAVFALLRLPIEFNNDLIPRCRKLMGERASWQYPSNGIYRWRSIKPPGCETTVLPICFGRIYRHGAREREGKRETNVVLQFLQPTTSYFARSIVTRKNTSSYFSRLITSLCPNLKCK